MGKQKVKLQDLESKSDGKFSALMVTHAKIQRMLSTMFELQKKLTVGLSKFVSSLVLNRLLLERDLMIRNFHGIVIAGPKELLPALAAPKELLPALEKDLSDPEGKRALADPEALQCLFLEKDLKTI